MQSVLTLDTFVYCFGSWAFGYWFALAFGGGWYFALGFAVAITVVVFSLARRWHVPRFDTTRESPDTAPLLVLLAAVLVWPVAFELDRSILFGIAIGLLAARLVLPFVRAVTSSSDLRFVALAAIALICTCAVWVSWTAAVVALCVIALIAVVRPRALDWFTNSERNGSARTALRVDPKIVAFVVLLALGLLISIWWTGINFWSSDNTYYLNKAAHYANSGISFKVHDYMYGFKDGQHYPFGDIFSAFEPLLGTASAVSRVAPDTLLFQVVVPLAMLLVPFSARYGARGLGLRRTNLIGALAAATVLLMTGLTTATLFATASYGKTISALVMVPLLVGAMGMLLRHKDAGSALRATMAAAGTVAFSPTLALAAIVIVLPFGVAGVWSLRPNERRQLRERLPSIASISAPLIFVTAYGLVTRAVQQHAGSSQLIGGFLAAGPEQAWERGTTGGPTTFLTDLFLVGSIALVPLLVRSILLKRATGLLVLFFFGVLFSPWLYETVMKRFPDLHYVAWRIPWAIPAGLVIGIAVAGVDQRRTLGLVTLVAAVMLMGLSGPDLSKNFLQVNADVRKAPTWPWDREIVAPLPASAHAIARVTPKGGRFLAPSSVEEVSTALLTDRYPVYARLHYAMAVGSAPHVPKKFFGKDRVLLAQGMAGAARNVGVDAWKRALEDVDVATVCVGKQTVPALRQAVQELYVARGSAAGLCDLWVRETTAP